MRNVYDVRAALDGLAALRTAGKLTPAQQRDGRRLLAAGRKLLTGRRDATQLLAADRALHHFIYEASGNTIALGLARTYWNRIAIVMLRVFESGYAEHAWDEHDAIFEAIVSGDEERAVELAQHHAWGAAEHVSAQLAAEQEATG